MPPRTHSTSKNPKYSNLMWGGIGGGGSGVARVSEHQTRALSLSRPPTSPSPRLQAAASLQRVLLQPHWNHPHPSPVGPTSSHARASSPPTSSPLSGATSPPMPPTPHPQPAEPAASGGPWGVTVNAGKDASFPANAWQGMTGANTPPPFHQQSRQFDYALDYQVGNPLLRASGGMPSKQGGRRKASSGGTKSFI